MYEFLENKNSYNLLKLNHLEISDIIVSTFIASSKVTYIYCKFMKVSIVDINLKVVATLLLTQTTCATPMTLQSRP